MKVLLYTNNVLWWLRERIAVHERRQLLWHGLHITTLHLCMLQICKLGWNRYLRSCTAMRTTLSLNHHNTFVYTDRNTDVSGMCTEIYGVASARGTGNGRHCHDYKHRLTGRRMYSLAYNCECTVSSACGNEESCVVVAIVAPLLQCRCINM